MKTRFIPIILTLILSLSFSAYSDQLTKTTKTVTWPSIQNVKLSIDERISENEYLIIKIKHFNYFKFDLTAKVEKEEIKSYTYLLDTFKILFKFKNLNLPIYLFDTTNNSEKELTQSFDNLLNHINKLEQQSWFTKISLSEEIREVESFKNELNSLQKKITKCYENFLASKSESVSQYKENYKSITDSSNKMDEILTWCIEGKDMTIGQNTAGSAVKVTFTAIYAKNDYNENHQKGKPITDVIENTKAELRYFVETSLPLEFHLGFAVKSIEDFDYEKVTKTTFDGFSNDFFQLVDDKDKSADIVSFLSFNFMKKSGLSLTLGTGLQNPGKDIYYGISKKFSCFYITAGGLYSEIKKVGEKTDKVKDTKVDLYELLKEERDNGFFVSISFNFSIFR